MSRSPDRRTVVGALTALAGLNAAGSRAAGAAAKRPNIIFFMGEGLRSDEFGFMGNRLLKTPHMCSRTPSSPMRFVCPRARAS